MSLYTELLGAAVEELRPDDEGSNVAQALAMLVAYRRPIGEAPALNNPGSLTAGLADQLGYDAALIDLARRLDIACGPDAFDPPAGARACLESRLAERGIDLPGL